MKIILITLESTSTWSNHMNWYWRRTCFYEFTCLSSASTLSYWLGEISTYIHAHTHRQDLLKSHLYLENLIAITWNRRMCSCSQEVDEHSLFTYIYIYKCKYFVNRWKIPRIIANSNSVLFVINFFMNGVVYFRQ